MITAIIVVSCLLAAGLVALFVTVQVMWHRTYKKALPNGEERPKQSAKEWFMNHMPTKRRLIQVYAALLYNANIKGFISGDIYKSETSKYMCVPGLNCYSCPGAVGACPLGALQNAFTSSATSASYYVLGILGLFGLILARTICGFLCPVGLGQDLLYKIRTPKLKKSRATRVFSYLKYVILIVLAVGIPLVYAVWNTPLPGFCKYICPAGTFGGAVLLLLNPSNAGTFASLGPLFTWKFCLLVAIVVAAIFIYRFFCRFLCPLGAIYGFFNRIALLGVKVDKDDCIDCGKCVAVCKMDVKRVGDHECINCGECISVCPTKAIRWKGSKLFLRNAAVREAAAEAEIKPINLAGGEIGLQPETQPKVPKTADVRAENVTAEVLQEDVVMQEQNRSDVITAPAGEEAAVKEQREQNAKPERRKKSRAFWLQLAAWIAALLVLTGALVYYNFIDVERARKVGYEVGDIAPDFTVGLYDSEGNVSDSYTLYENRGMLTVINFWATSSEDQEELSYFNELSKNHPEWNVIAIHGDDQGGQSGGEYIKENCNGWSLTFAQDKIENSECVTYKLFGGSGELPMTVILDGKGIVLYNSTDRFEDYWQLEDLVYDLEPTGYEVGDTAPDFTVDLYDSEGNISDSYTLYGNRGKLTVINFWATWCSGCIEELPYFNELSANHPEWNVIAIHGDAKGGKSGGEYIKENFSDWTLTFAQDQIQNAKCVTFQMLGGKSMWPMTVIVDEEGVVLYNSTQPFKSYAQLEDLVNSLI